MINGKLKENTLIIRKKENPNWRVLWGKGIGENEEKSLKLEPVEALYLLFHEKIQISTNEREITEKHIIEKFTREREDIWKKFLLYNDMKRRGYNLTIKERRIQIYERGESPPSSEPISVLIPIPALTPITLKTLVREVKEIQDKDLDLILGIVDRDGTITHYKVNQAFKQETTLKLRRRSE